MKDFWQKKHQKYSTEEWINKPTVFAQFSISYFPGAGSLLDLGAGQGQDSRYFAQHGFDVTSSDYSDVALEMSRRKAEKEGLHIKFMELDIADKLPLEDGTFDVVYSHLALHYFTDEKTREIFREIKRILKPGGVLACMFNTVEDPETSDENFKRVEKDYYLSPDGVLKRYFSVDYIESVTKDLFEPLVMDNKGGGYKEKINSLIRFIGRVKKS
ncbi:class I SAM-dependent methyltransferase [Candidatus Falkowbacteria bacterium]|nr:class I SAM-dependent methyltransferase [Candidatus Falkowbacteria bacterium]